MDKKQNKSRIGIITFHRALNYGALLQAYALQTVIVGIGCKCQIINYHSPSIDKKVKEITLSNCKNIKGIYRYIFYSRNHNKKMGKFRDFSLKFLNLSAVCTNNSELKKLSSTYDCLISGSDQVWNFKITDSDEAYLLGFEEDGRKKNAYSASFGISDIPEEKVEAYQYLLNDYNQISVREKTGAEMVKKLIGRDVEVTLDPTLLLNKTDWLKLAVEYKRKDDYILFYGFGMPTSMKSFLSTLARKTGLQIVVISQALRNRVKGIYEKCVGPEEYLGLFKNARYVVTNSFHGIAFSINFNKDFFFEQLPASDLINVNSRIENIRNLFSLQNREITNGVNSNVDKPIDYSLVNKILEEERRKSMMFLNQIVRPS